SRRRHGVASRVAVGFGFRGLARLSQSSELGAVTRFARARSGRSLVRISLADVRESNRAICGMPFQILCSFGFTRRGTKALRAGLERGGYFSARRPRPLPPDPAK